ncbi:YveK family protein [Halobacillus halophilus]|uniref:YveK family protein n=1 Tax=Halobacillus halophilus TaxID=1570 RepID=UPI001CD6E0EE|nr:Wzz/FepE/Etk N-terminal domain-containing protein [Halobacillus halophilus]MCA1010100.1 capsular biosynthesis protein [Halobacillus halophilus]
MNIKRQKNFIDDGRSSDINLKEYFDVIKRRAWIIIVLMLLTTSAGIAYTHLNNTLLYQTSTRIILETEDKDMNTLMVMIKDPIIMDEVKKLLNLEISDEELASKITVDRLDESQVVLISVTDTSPERAANIANSTAQVYKKKIGDILSFEEVQLLSEAKLNPMPINENQSRNLVAAAVFGLIVGVGIVFLLDTLDGTIRSRHEIEEYLDIPVIGSVSTMNRRNTITNKKKKQSSNVEARGEKIDIKQNQTS